MTAQHRHRLIDGALKLRAQEYVGTLSIGATVDANDRRYLAETDWGRHFDAALAERGWRVENDVVVAVSTVDNGRDAAE